MPSDPITQTLLTLLPTHPTPPPELHHLSASLLAQSRTKASSLKPEEEIARTYACCHIACQRLGHKLALEIADPTPPVKPRVYAKLVAFFNSVLATPRKGGRGDRGKGGDGDGVGVVRGGERGENGQVERKAVVRSAVLAGKRAAPASPLLRDKTVEVHVPRYVMPMIRHMCSALNTPAAAPHVFAGVQSVLQTPDWQGRASKRRRTDTKATDTDHDDDFVGGEESIPLLTTALFLAVTEKMYPNHPTTQDEEEHTNKAIQAAKAYITSNPAHNPPSILTVVPGLPVTLELDRLKRSYGSIWQDMEWYRNIPTHSISLADADAEAEAEADIDAPDLEDKSPRSSTRTRPAKTPLGRAGKRGKKVTDVGVDGVGDVDGEEEAGAAGLLPGLATMFQPALDWLSEERRAEYVVWKRGILGEIERMVDGAGLRVGG